MCSRPPAVRALLLAGAACRAAPPPGAAVLVPTATRDGVPRRIHVAATRHGFEPDRLDVAVGETAILVFTRTAERTCAKDVVVFLSKDATVGRELPLNMPVEIALAFTRAGEIGFSCGMRMLGGALHVHPPTESKGASR